MSRELKDLDSRFRPIAEELIRYLAEERKITVLIVDTLRTHEEQLAAVRRGTSWTNNSKHLPQGVEQKSWAIDLVPIAPVDLTKKKGWAPDHPLWWDVAKAAVRLGLRSGMDWKDKGLPPVGDCSRSSWDPGHAEWRGPGKGK